MLTTDATSLPRLMQCNGSRLMQADPTLPNLDTTVRDEGNAAHWLASVVFNGQFTVDEMVDRKAPNGVFITADIADHVADYLGTSGNDASTLMEWGYSIAGQSWQVNGRGDRFIHPISFDGTLCIDDLKYGYSVVEPERNWTLIAHAIGYCQSFNIAPARIVFTIHQPRAKHRNGTVREWSIDYATLLELYNELSQTLSDPSDELQTGPQCYKCPAFASCPARQLAELTGVETAHDAFNSELTDIELTARLTQLDRVEQLVKQSKKAYEELMLYRISKGSVFRNFGIENELTNRMWKDGVTVDFFAALTGRNIAKQELPTPAQAERLGISKEVVAALATRKSKGSKLARMDTDKRAEKAFGKMKRK